MGEYYIIFKVSVKQIKNSYEDNKLQWIHNQCCSSELDEVLSYYIFFIVSNISTPIYVEESFILWTSRIRE